MINYLGKEGEKKLANALYYGGGAVGKAQRNLAKRRANTSVVDEKDSAEPETTSETETTKTDLSANLGSGLGLAATAVSALDNDPEYGNADVASSALQFASMGATAGPIGAAIGGAVGLGVGLLTKNKQKKEKARQEKIKQEKDLLQAGLDKQARQAEAFQHGGEVQESESLQPYHKIHADYSGKFGYGSGLVGPNDNPRFYEKMQKESMEHLMPSAETTYKLATRFIDPAKMPDLSIYSDRTNLPKAPVVYDANQKDEFDTRMQKSGMNYNTINRMTTGSYQTGGMTKGAYSHKTNPLAVVDKNGNHTGMELTGGEGVFDKPAMEKIKRMVAGGRFKEAGMFVNNEMKTWKHK